LFQFLVKEAKMATRILLCSDEPILGRGIEDVLGRVEGFESEPSCRTVAGMMKQLEGGAPDLLLLDLTSEITCALLSDLKRTHPNMKILLWANAISTETAVQALGLGVRGVLRKTLPIDLQVKCLKKVQAGELWFEKTLTDDILARRHPALTPRENQLLDLLIQGLKNKEIATAMEIEEGSVKVFLSRLFQKLGVKDRFELALFGLKYRAEWQFPAAIPSGREKAPSRLPTAMPASV
jgi:DNA-binding NarL/FixJ family response regulator